MTYLIKIQRKMLSVFKMLPFYHHDILNQKIVNTGEFELASHKLASSLRSANLKGPHPFHLMLFNFARIPSAYLSHRLERKKFIKRLSTTF